MKKIYKIVLLLSFVLALGKASGATKLFTIDIDLSNVSVHPLYWHSITVNLENGIGWSFQFFMYFLFTNTDEI